MTIEKTKLSILFIVNPISGVGKQKVIETLVDSHLDSKKFQTQFAYTEYAGHAIEIADKASNEYDIVVAVGGDGTINEVASGLVHSNCTLGIIPTGSGNGFARHLHIPLQLEKAVKLLNTAKTIKIDTAKLNDRTFVNVSGIGFDAEVGHLFANYGTRGPLSYVKVSASAYRKYKPVFYHLFIDGEELKTEAFAMSFANTSQFGNNAHIAPFASVQDGFIDLSIIKSFPVFSAVPLAVRLFNKKLPKSRYYAHYSCKEIVLKNSGKAKVHIDGEPELIEGDIAVTLVPNSLQVLCPSNTEKV